MNKNSMRKSFAQVKVEKKNADICQQLSYCVAFKEMTKVVAIYASPFMRSPLNVIP